jgi:hypothetical protein
LFARDVDALEDDIRGVRRCDFFGAFNVDICDDYFSTLLGEACCDCGTEAGATTCSLLDKVGV